MIKSIYLNRNSNYLNEKLKVHIKINSVNSYYKNLFNYKLHRDKMIAQFSLFIETNILI